MKKPIRYILPLILLILAVSLISLSLYRNYNNAEIQVNLLQNANGHSAYRININTATAEELDQLPKIGPELAKRIVAYREENGDFRSIWDLLLVPGLGESHLNAIKNYICLR